MECVSICNQHLCSCGNSTKKHFTSVKFKMADFFSTVKLKAKSANTLKSYKGIGAGAVQTSKRVYKVVIGL